MMTPEEKAYVQKLEAENRELKAIVIKQSAYIAKLESRIAELERRLGMDSTNSSKPPSTDGLKKKNRSLRKPSGKKAGGQAGHKGTTLKLPCSPTETISCDPEQSRQCSSFGQCQGKEVESRYEIDTELKVIVCKYVQMEYVCPKSHHLLCGQFPEHITATKQYGHGIQDLIINLNTECAVSDNKIHHLLKSLLKVPVSPGFIQKVVKKFASSLAPALDSIKRHLDVSYAVHGDETGVRTDNAMAWVHNASTDLYTYQYVAERRGKDGIAEAGFIPGYKGILEHDC